MIIKHTKKIFSIFLTVNIALCLILALPKYTPEWQSLANNALLACLGSIVVSVSLYFIYLWVKIVRAEIKSGIRKIFLVTSSFILVIVLLLGGSIVATGIALSKFLEPTIKHTYNLGDKKIYVYWSDCFPDSICECSLKGLNVSHVYIQSESFPIWRRHVASTEYFVGEVKTTPEGTMIYSSKECYPDSDIHKLINIY